MNEDRESMTVETFDDLLEARGSNLALWPEAERQRAERLLLGDPEARQALAQAQAFDAHLVDALSVSVQPTAIASRAESAIAARRETWTFSRLLAPLPLGFGVAAIAVGMLAGWLFPIGLGVDADTMLLAALGGGVL